MRLIKTPANKMFINYSHYSYYSMDNTTIQLTNETKRKIASFGSKSESYDEIIQRLYDMAVKVQLREFLTSGDAIPIEEAIAEAECGTHIVNFS